MTFRFWKPFALCAVVTSWSMLATAQVASEQELKAAFLFNFVKFTEWPADALASGAPLPMCVTDGAVAETLEQIVNGKVVQGHALTVSQVKAETDLRSCALVYVHGSDSTRSAQILLRLKGTSVLSVGDVDDFTAQGGIVQFVIENGRIRFAINIAAAEGARLRFSAQLLSLAKIREG